MMSRQKDEVSVDSLKLMLHLSIFNKYLAHFCFWWCWFPPPSFHIAHFVCVLKNQWIKTVLAHCSYWFLSFLSVFLSPCQWLKSRLFSQIAAHAEDVTRAVYTVMMSSIVLQSMAWMNLHWHLPKRVFCVTHGLWVECIFKPVFAVSVEEVRCWQLRDSPSRLWKEAVSVVSCKGS